MSKKTLRLAEWAIGLSMALAGAGAALGASKKAPMETKAGPGDEHSIVFANSAKSATAISSTTKASTVIGQGTNLVATSPFSVTGNAYYGDTQTCIRLGKSAAKAATLTITLSASAQALSWGSITVNCEAYNASNVGTLSVNGEDPLTTPDPGSANNLSFNLSTSTFSEITLESTLMLKIYRITLTEADEKTHIALSADDCVVDLEDGDFSPAVSEGESSASGYVLSSGNTSVVQVLGDNVTLRPLRPGTSQITVTKESQDPDVVYDSCKFTVTVEGFDKISDIINSTGTGWGTGYAENQVVHYGGVVVGKYEDGAGYHSYFVQNGSQGLLAYKVADSILTETISFGDPVEVTGALTTYTGTIFETKNNTVFKKNQSFADVIIADELDATKWSAKTNGNALVSATGITYTSGTFTVGAISNLYFTLSDGSTQIQLFIPKANATAELGSKLGVDEDGHLITTEGYYNLTAVKYNFTKNSVFTPEVYFVDGSSLTSTNDEDVVDAWVETYVTGPGSIDYTQTPEAQRPAACEGKYDAAMTAFNNDLTGPQRAYYEAHTMDKYATAADILARWKAAKDSLSEASKLSINRIAGHDASTIIVASLAGFGAVAACGVVLLAKKRKEN